MSTPRYQKLAVIFGCNYYGQNSLHGCINDANAIKEFLISKRGFEPSNVLTVYDKKMTRRTMFKTLEDLSSQTFAIAKREMVPAVFLYYSGHGVQVPDRKNIESDGAAEALVPYDFEKSELIVDHELFDRFIKKLHPASELFLFTDCCNSGTNFNLAYNGMSRAYENHDIAVNVIGLSGCSDTQTSAEISGRGLATMAFIKSMERPAKVANIADFRKAMADVSIPGHLQTPQVSVSNKKLVTGKLFNWLIEDKREAQLSQRELQRLAKQHKHRFFIDWVGQGLLQLTGRRSFLQA